MTVTVTVMGRVVRPGNVGRGIVETVVRTGDVGLPIVVGLLFVVVGA